MAAFNGLRINTEVVTDSFSEVRVPAVRTEHTPYI
jgi:hypothetical protein